MTLDEQLEFIGANAQTAFDEMLEFALAHRESIIAAMPMRLIGGYPDYRDSSWQLPADRMARGLIEELVDACNWRAFELYRRSQYVVLPEPTGAPDD